MITFMEGMQDRYKEPPWQSQLEHHQPFVKRVLSPQHRIELELSRSAQASKSVMGLCHAMWHGLYVE